VSTLARIAIAAALVLGAARADAAPAAERVVLADTDPELQRAVATALLPWKLEIIVSTDVPADADDAERRADDQTARFVVWRQGNDLVVYDRLSNSSEHREAPTGALDPVSAAAAALTVKTLMRLPPLPESNVPPPAVDDALEIRVQAGVDTRIARGAEETEFGARFVGAAMIRPWSIDLRFGVAGALGTAANIDRAGFKGTWTDYQILGLASYTWSAGAWEVEPYAGGGVARSSLSGTEMAVPRDETATLGFLRGGVWVRHRFAILTVGAGVAVDGTLATPTYTRMGGAGQPLFDVPSFAASFGLVAAADFGR
jgi:hypothetical protein